ncbi:MAG: response regulator of the LytR/AlgR family [Bacteroidetes bacterium]|nr:MAG: response regulator of the LytR/AlgR family [Bacteroidota bacterium]
MNNPFKILIADDEVLIAEFLKDVLAELGYVNLVLAHNRRQVMIQLEESRPDLVLLDIRMKDDLEGIQIAERINADFKIPFIYITAQSDKEIIQKALGTKPAGYITKPFKEADVFAAVKLVEENAEINNEKFLVFKDGYTTVKISVDDVLYAKSNDNYIDLYTTTKKYTLRYTLEWLCEHAPVGMFHRTHRSAVVNITKITRATSKSVFIGDVEIPVSRGNQVKL